MQNSGCQAGDLNDNFSRQGEKAGRLGDRIGRNFEPWALCIKFNSIKRKHLLLSMIWYNLLSQFIIIAPDMPLIRTYIGHPLVASQIWEAIPIEVNCLSFNTFKKEYKRLLLDSQGINFNYHLAVSIN